MVGGGHQFVMGGAVKGGDIYGNLPLLELGGVEDFSSNGHGRIIPGLASDQMSATLCLWFASGIDVRKIFPSLVNFPISNIGFMHSS